MVFFFPFGPVAESVFIAQHGLVRGKCDLSADAGAALPGGQDAVENLMELFVQGQGCGHGLHRGKPGAFPARGHRRVDLVLDALDNGPAFLVGQFRQGIQGGVDLNVYMPKES